MNNNCKGLCSIPNEGAARYAEREEADSEDKEEEEGKRMVDKEEEELFKDDEGEEEAGKEEDKDEEEDAEEEDEKEGVEKEEDREEIDDVVMSLLFDMLEFALCVKEAGNMPCISPNILW